MAIGTMSSLQKHDDLLKLFFRASLGQVVVATDALAEDVRIALTPPPANSHLN